MKYEIAYYPKTGYYYPMVNNQLLKWDAIRGIYQVSGHMIVGRHEPEIVKFKQRELAINALKHFDRHHTEIPIITPIDINKEP